MSLSLAKSSTFIDPSEYTDKRIIVIGAGATGSNVVLQLARLGFVCHVYDDDKVESKNVNNQCYFNKDIDKYKVEALQEQCLEIDPEYLEKGGAFFTKRITKSDRGIFLEKPNIVFMLADKGRKDLGNLLRMNSQTKLVIETRIGLTDGNVYHFNPQKPKHFKIWLANLPVEGSGPPPEELSPCGTELSVFHVVTITAGRAVSVAAAFFRNELDKVPNEAVFQVYPFFDETYTMFWDTIK